MNCDVRDGRVIVITSSGDKVEIADVPDSIQLTKVLEAAIGHGSGVKNAAAGASAEAVDDSRRRRST